MPSLSFVTPVIADSLAVGTGAICGALCRHHVGKYVTECISKDPGLRPWIGWHTAGINIVGSFVLGGMIGLSPTSLSVDSGRSTALKPRSYAFNPESLLTPRVRLLIGVGFCGSFTTKGEMAKAISYALANNVGGVTAAATGMIIAKKMYRI